MHKLIENFKLSNVLLSKVLKDESLVLNQDTLFEISYPLNNAIAFNFNGIRTSVFTDTDYDLIDKTLSYKDNINFLFNGECNDDLIKLIDMIIEDGSFNIGICTDDELEYKRSVSKYKRLKNIIEKKHNIEVNTIDKSVDDHKVYMLSYRHK